MIFRLLVILIISLYIQVGHTYKDESKTVRTYKGFISATLNSDKNINEQMFVREYFNEFEPTKDFFDFTGDKDPEISYRLWFNVLDLSGELFKVNIILESLSRENMKHSNVVYNETVNGVLYGNNQYELTKDGLPSLSIDIEIDKNFTSDELKERFNQ